MFEVHHKHLDGIHCQRPTPPPTAFSVPNINVGLYLRDLVSKLLEV